MSHPFFAIAIKEMTHFKLNYRQLSNFLLLHFSYENKEVKANENATKIKW